MIMDFDYKTAPLVDALRQYPKDIPDLGYNGQYLMREAAAEIELFKAIFKEAADYLDVDKAICAGSIFHDAFVDAGGN
jgi:hypothetical protein